MAINKKVLSTGKHKQFEKEYARFSSKFKKSKLRV